MSFDMFKNKKCQMYNKQSNLMCYLIFIMMLNQSGNENNLVFFTCYEQFISIYCWFFSKNNAKNNSKE